MIELKQTIFIWGILALMIGGILYIEAADWRHVYVNRFENENVSTAEVSESYFNGFNYFVYKDEKNIFNLNADEGVLSEFIDRTVFFFYRPQGTFLLQNGRQVEYLGTKGKFLKDSATVEFSENISLQSSTEKIKSEELSYFVNEMSGKASKNVFSETIVKDKGDKIVISSDELRFEMKNKKTRYSGNVKGEIKRKKVYEDSVYFWSNDLYLDELSYMAELAGQVTIKKGNFQAMGNRGEIFLENYNKKLKYYVLYDDVKLTEEGPRVDPKLRRRAYAEKVEGFVFEDRIVLTGNPKVFQQDNDVVTGNRIVLRSNNQVVEVDDANSSFSLKK